MALWVIIVDAGGRPSLVGDDGEPATFQTLGEARRLMRRHILGGRVQWYLDLQTGATEGPA